MTPEPPSAQIQLFPRRYRYTTVVAAAVAAVTLFGAGYFIGGGTGPSPSQQTVVDERPG